ncbi:MAG TPA: sensor domain-containing diguanylate cyclase [Kouleothrix sp.]|nr:sensor domain-containing diguanylate cyclase [Kouleothrix sp.]HRC75477.1 sensor domain-containing diguanylate cyclase [Kouleothrix sp.]
MDPSNITTSQLLAILDITRRLADQRMVQPLAHYVATTVFELVPAERCLIVLFGEGGAMQVEIALDRQGKPLDIANDQISHSILDRVRATLSPLLVNNALDDNTFKAARSVRALGLRSVMCAPLVSYGSAVGAIYVENRSIRGRFHEDSLMPLVLLANQVTVALENTRMVERLEAQVTERTRALEDANALLRRQAAELHQQSILDSLTGLYNRRYFTAQLPQMLYAASRYGRPLTLALLDIDHFKQINDTFYHAGGDRVLVAIAELLRSHMRAADSLARIGGEEFAVILPETASDAAWQVVERLRVLVDTFSWDTIAPTLRVTISAGVAQAHDDDSIDTLLHRADIQLYEAKRAGRNRVASPAAA